MMKKAFVTGWPISHSRSPALHGFWLEQYRILGSYEAIPVSESDLTSFIENFEKQGYCGGNVTIPHKEAVYALVSEKDQAAEKIGAVNTLWMENGKLHASNTDAYGFSANLDDVQPNWREGQKALVLGAGGASRAIIFSLQQAGFTSIFIVNRTASRAHVLADHFGSGCSGHGLDEFSDYLAEADLLVNTTSIGMNGEDENNLPDLTPMRPECIVTDIVYTPLQTPLLQKAKSLGNPTVDGLGMLLHQAVPGFEKWFGVKPEVTVELRNHVLGLS